jgi:hypothetical protein
MEKRGGGVPDLVVCSHRTLTAARQFFAKNARVLVVHDDSLALDQNLAPFRTVFLIDLDRSSVALNEMAFNNIRHNFERPTVVIFKPTILRKTKLVSKKIKEKKK